MKTGAGTNHLPAGTEWRAWTTTWPESGSRRPAISRSVVDLPVPEPPAAKHLAEVREDMASKAQATL